jgi:hypothetical protein
MKVVFGAIALSVLMCPMSSNANIEAIEAKCNYAPYEAKVTKLEESLAKYKKAFNEVEDCKTGWVNLRVAPKGFRCRAPGGGIWEKVTESGAPETWKSPDGVHWGPYIGYIGPKNHHQYCDNGWRKPSVKEFWSALSLGMTEVLPKIQNGWFWTKDTEDRPGQYVWKDLYILMFSTSGNGTAAVKYDGDSLGHIRCVY